MRMPAELLRHPDEVLAADQLLRLALADLTGVGPERVKHSVLRLRRRLRAGQLVPGAGFEPAPPCGEGGLSPRYHVQRVLIRIRK